MRYPTLVGPAMASLEQPRQVPDIPEQPPLPEPEPDIPDEPPPGAPDVFLAER